MISSTMPDRMSRFCSSSSTRFISCWYSVLSACARSARTAGPFPVFNILICMCVLSITLAICPPSASTSLTTIPLAGPPTDGLHGMNAILSRLMVSINVLRPLRAEASPASTPACPAPMTTTSYFIFPVIVFLLLFSKTELAEELVDQLFADIFTNDFPKQFPCFDKVDLYDIDRYVHLR